jgi:hypothetical protein
MQYAIVVIVGIACSFLMPRRGATPLALLVFGLVALCISVGLGALAFSYNQDQLQGMLSLSLDPKHDPIGFLPLVGIGYAAMVGAVGALARLLVRKNRAPRTPPSRREGAPK